MVEANQGPVKAAPLAHKGDHDRIAMLSLKADGTADQHNPEVIIDKEEAVAATERQFAQQAVSVVDVEERGVTAGAGAVTLVGQEDGSVKEEELRTGDPNGDELLKKHQAAEKAGQSAARGVIDKLAKG